MTGHDYDWKVAARGGSAPQDYSSSTPTFADFSRPCAPNCDADVTDSGGP
jgi:hypothetical protein